VQEAGTEAETIAGVAATGRSQSEREALERHASNHKDVPLMDVSAVVTLTVVVYKPFEVGPQRVAHYQGAD
jgi:hypothetical protein